VVVLWGTGFGPTNPPISSGVLISGAHNLSNTVTVTIGGKPAAVDFAGVIGAGLVQINVHIPGDLPNGDAPVVATIAGQTTQLSSNLIPIQN
jgi:uncharacterized protein (TIGR03437 family)